VISRAVLCPSPPLLARELTGLDPAVPGLREACAQAVSWLIRDAPGQVIVVGPAPSTADWDPGSRLDLSIFAPGLDEGGKPDLPLSLGLGALLLDQAGHAGSRVLQAVGDSEPPARCIRLGQALAATAARAFPGEQAVLLAMGDGSARRTVSAPGHLDERAIPFDDEVRRAVHDGDLAALAALDPALTHELMATGRPAWQVLAGALGPGTPDTGILYAGAPFGVAYLVARFEAARQPAGSRRAGLAPNPRGQRAR